MGVSWALTAVSGALIYADLELPGQEWVAQTSTFIFSLIFIPLTHWISALGSKAQKEENPN